MTIDTYSPAWRLECLARHVLRKPLDDRREWLADFQKIHGKRPADRLKAVIVAEHAKPKPP